VKVYDVIVIGAGVGSSIVFKALAAGRRVALVSDGPAGGTCVNVGCLPSKMLLAAADAVTEIGRSDRLGVAARVESIAFPSIMDRMRRAVDSGRESLEKSLQGESNLDWYRSPGSFIDDRTLTVAGETIRGQQVFIASGSSPSAPAVPGLNEVLCLNNESVLQLRE
jgi:mycothione reductase